MKKLQKLIREVHESPLEIVKEVDQDLLNLLIPKSIDLSTKIPKEIYEDLSSYLAEIDKKWSEQALQSKFMYFANEMIHLFGTYDARKIFYPSVIISKKPYIWINIFGNDANIVRYRGIEKKIVRVTLHVVKPRIKMKAVKWSFNLEKRTKMQFNKGSSLQLAVRLDGAKNYAYLSLPHPEMDCIVLLTYQMEYNGVYHKGKNKLIVGVH